LDGEDYRYVLAECVLEEFLGKIDLLTISNENVPIEKHVWVRKRSN
jgi:hypothetical protein